MSRIELAPEVGDDFDRILDYLAQYQVENPVLRIREIIEALNVLEHNPLIGRPANNGKRELLDIVFILAVRGQREAGYTGL
ncbi:MAG: hypothetical protein FD134_2046 [Gallionellaceae bacterium]|nr:MAG: hypothetical protein FD134_2046 [Gallionellaceae bacterium]